jgi:hypothetical protein
LSITEKIMLDAAHPLNNIMSCWDQAKDYHCLWFEQHALKTPSYLEALNYSTLLKRHGN